MQYTFTGVYSNGRVHLTEPVPFDDEREVLITFTEKTATEKSGSASSGRWKREDYPPDVDPLLVGVVNPLIYGKGEIHGDIVSPLDEEWENTVPVVW